MTIENLNCFLILAEELSFTRASKKAHITQAALSRRISSLEVELGVQLFSRNRHTVFLTPTGQELLLQIRPVLEDYDNAICRVQNIAKGVVDVVRVGIGSYEQHLLSPVIQEFVKKHPITQIHFFQYKYRELVEEFNRRHLDLIVSSDQFFELLTGDNLEYLLLHDHPWALILNRKNPLAALDPVPIADLNTQNIITMNRSSLGVLSDLYKGRFTPSRADFVNSCDTKLLLVLANRGVGFVPEFMDLGTYPGIVTRGLSPHYRPRKFFAVFRKDSPNLCASMLAGELYSYYQPTLWMQELPQ
ncbi:MAG: LysR family transcriptional regulator [Lachnospiraceae bacterium]|jgi:DNA-binding transcriptional LysR family regulator|nr:LysR family transcriptional regulator [Lachnospiraceae bacterium]